MTNLKSDLRKVLKKKRLSLSIKRREEAKVKACKMLYSHLKPFKAVLSFCPRSEEIDLHPLNIRLAREGRLSLPVCESNGELTPYFVSNLKKDLQNNTKTGVREPNKEYGKRTCLEELGAILVPGLGFNADGHRLGFGRGYYDRFLEKVSCMTFGIGFKEQLLLNTIPVEGHDIVLTEILLF